MNETACQTAADVTERELRFLLNEARQEIEPLHAEIERMHRLHRINADARDEIERNLIAEIERRQSREWALEALIERLRAALNRILDVGEVGLRGEVYTTGEGHARCMEIARKGLEE